MPFLCFPFRPCFWGGAPTAQQGPSIPPGGLDMSLPVGQGRSEREERQPEAWALAVALALAGHPPAAPKAVAAPPL